MKKLLFKTSDRRSLAHIARSGSISCSVSAKNEMFFGKTTPPELNISACHRDELSRWIHQLVQDNPKLGSTWRCSKD